jgi:hypothetical protein
MPRGELGVWSSGKRRDEVLSDGSEEKQEGLLYHKDTSKNDAKEEDAANARRPDRARLGVIKIYVIIACQLAAPSKPHQHKFVAG